MASSLHGHGRASVFTAGIVALLGGCTTDANDGLPPSLAPLPPGPAVEADDLPPEATARMGTVRLHAGFNPDPRVIEGTAIGEVEAATLHRRCKGWLSAQPDYLVSAETAFLQIFAIARAHAAVSLVLRKPDGSVVCKRPRGSARPPILRTGLPLGTSELWVGVSRQGEEVPYRVGFSEVSWKSSSVPLPDDG